MDDRVLKCAFGNVLRRHRKALNLSQESLAYGSGLHRTYVSLLERGIKSPTLISIIHIASALGKRPEDLVKAVLAEARRVPDVKRKRGQREIRNNS